MDKYQLIETVFWETAAALVVWLVPITALILTMRILSDLIFGGRR